MFSTSPPPIVTLSNESQLKSSRHISSQMSSTNSDNNESDTTKSINMDKDGEEGVTKVNDSSDKSNVGTPKKKNARKREKLKKLIIPAQNVSSKSTNVESSPQGDTMSSKVEPSTSQEFTTATSQSHRNNANTSRNSQNRNGIGTDVINNKFGHLNIPQRNAGQPLMHQVNIQKNSAINDYFLNHVIPLYAPVTSRYLENLRHHPQFNVVANSNSQHLFNGYIPSLSSPTSPFTHGNHVPGSGSSPNSPLIQQNANSPKYLQNVMQHPLLNQTMYIHNSQHNVMGNLKAKNSNGERDGPSQQNHGNGSKTDKSNNQKFDAYMSQSDVELGLKNNTLFEGVLRINPKQFQHAYVSTNDRSLQDVLIDGIKNRNRALEGDLVVVQVLESDSEENIKEGKEENKNEEDKESNKEENKQRKGKVVYIKEKVHLRTCIGLLKLMPDKNRQRALFIPRDYRIPRLNVPFTFWPNNFYQNSKKYENTLFLAKIIDWFDTRFAVAKIVCNIGEIGDMQSETKAILAQTDIDVSPFSPALRDLYPKCDYVIPQEEINLREDCRNLCIFSIDPYNCRDIDDAVSCRVLENGNYEIGVHISDVSFFLSENTALDEKVAEKATTVYLVEKAYHMLPDELCLLCSLFPGIDKLAFSIFWEITDDAKIVSSRFSKTVIHSCCQLAYEHAQSILEDKEDAESNLPEIYNNFKYKDIYESIKTLGKISAIMRKQRFENGALSIDQPKVSFNLSPENGLPESFWIYENKQSHQLIEEFMLLANMTVAQRIYDDYPQLAFLRCHPQPSKFMLQQLAKSLKPIGIDLEIDSAGALQRSLQPHVDPSSDDKGKAMVLSMLCAKPMARAKYFCAGASEEDFHHYALNVPLYTHFTSPIRRYADIMVHRLLSASINYREVPKWDIDKVKMIAAQCNKQKYNAKKAGELSTELYTLKYIEMHSPVTTEAVVVEVREKYIDVIIIAMGLNRRIFFNNDFPGEYNCIKNEAGMKLSKMELTWNATEDLPQVKQTISVFSTLLVEMHKGDDIGKVDMKLVRPQQSQSAPE